MTPNNIAGMARIKGLDVIAVCDHNSALNLPAVKRAADDMGVLLLPGIEATSREEVHVLCYMPTVEAAMALGARIRATLPMPNMPDMFGRQLIMNENDEITGTEDKLLIQAGGFSVEELAAAARELGGVPVPAHVNRAAFSVLSILGFIPPDARFTTIEVSPALPLTGADASQYHVLTSSDAHYLPDILERHSYLPIDVPSVEAILAYMASPR